MRPSTPLSFDRLREQVEALMEAGEPFAHVERAIDATASSEEHKAALWLVAWSLNDRSGPAAPAAPGRPQLELLSGSLEA